MLQPDRRRQSFPLLLCQSALIDTFPGGGDGVVMWISCMCWPLLPLLLLPLMSFDAALYCLCISSVLADCSWWPQS